MNLQINCVVALPSLGSSQSLQPPCPSQTKHIATYCKSRQKTRLPNKWSQVAARDQVLVSEFGLQATGKPVELPNLHNSKHHARYLLVGLQIKSIIKFSQPKKLLQSIRLLFGTKNLKFLSDLTCSGQFFHFFPWPGQKNHPGLTPTTKFCTGDRWMIPKKMVNRIFSSALFFWPSIYCKCGKKLGFAIGCSTHHPTHFIIDMVGRCGSYPHTLPACGKFAPHRATGVLPRGGKELHQAVTSL